MTDAVRLRDVVVGWPGFRCEVGAWSVPAGARAGVVGPSGSGKSTLLGVLSGEWPALSGEVEVLGARVDRMTDAARRAWRVQHVGQVFQAFPLLDALDVRDNVLLPYRLHPALRVSAAVRARAEALLERLDLAPLARRWPATLSQGERQRVAVARSLIARPGLVLADEPTTGLDPARRDAVVALLTEACAVDGATLVLVTHDPGLAARCAPVCALGAV